jgi:hypothetical protein
LENHRCKNASEFQGSEMPWPSGEQGRLSTRSGQADLTYKFQHATPQPLAAADARKNHLILRFINGPLLYFPMFGISFVG